MKKRRKLLIEQLDRVISVVKTVPDAPNGWIGAVRSSLGITYSQMATRLGLTPQGVRGLEKREQDGSISLKKLRELAAAMDMKLVYALVPKAGSLEEMIDQRAFDVAKKIVMRTDVTMRLEDQGVEKERREKAIVELAEEIKRDMPRYLWD